MKKIIALLCLMLSSQSFAWVQAGNVKIREFIQWETPNNNGYVVFKFDDQNSTTCYVPLQEKELYSAVLAFYIAQKEVNIHCHDEKENKGGYNSHKLHRINAH